MSRPSNITRPASGATVPVIMPNSVVLPAPFGPMHAERLAVGDVEVDARRRRPPRRTASRSFPAPGWKSLNRCGRARNASSGSSWPDLFRPSTTCLWRRTDVDGRDKHGHDAEGVLFNYPLRLAVVEDRAGRGTAPGHQKATKSSSPAHDSICSLPPTGISGAGLLAMMTSSNLSFSRCHWPADQRRLGDVLHRLAGPFHRADDRVVVGRDDRVEDRLRRRGSWRA